MLYRFRNDFLVLKDNDCNVLRVVDGFYLWADERERVEIYPGCLSIFFQIIVHCIMWNGIENYFTIFVVIVLYRMKLK